MVDHEERISATLRAVSDDLRARPTLLAEVRTGALRRQRRRRVAGGAAIAAAAVLVASAVAAGGLRSVAGPERPLGTHVSTSPSPTASRSAEVAAPGTCRIDRLPVPEGHPRSLVTGGDPTGRFLVGRAYGSTGFVARHPLLIWDDGVPTRVDMPGDDEAFDDITSTGMAVGSAFTGRDTQSAFVYRDGKLTRLRAPAGSVQARAVAENGTIVGNLGGGSEPYQPLVWSGPDGEAQFLPLPDGFPEGETVDVDDDGTVLAKVSVAGSRGPDGGDHAHVWAPDGSGRLLPMPEVGGKPAQTFWPISIHDGVVFGRAARPIGSGGVSFDSFLFNLRTGTYTPLTHAFGLVGTSEGWIVGQEWDGPFVAAPGGRAPLPMLVPLSEDPVTRLMNMAVHISADGTVIGGQAVDDKSQIQAVRWRCTKVV
ncbi:hypothetical protein [Virgisporangium ochraceum]|uniref:Uncharacterized protein n=1 Tax=Virgisporangium ochraceum TaxID=65505 RepID=A0A8J3ZSJ9_9ACTN|nr:hypothetical protein [Virgisporangium ochraceum]GIJ67268.1 hypothetical protein Voc01_021850 [Virgisporangium ochraceum]